MQQNVTVLGGPNAAMPMDAPPGGPVATTTVSGPVAPAAGIDLTQPRPLPNNVDVFGPPTAGQIGFDEFQVSQQTVMVGDPESAGAIPRSVPLDETPLTPVQVSPAAPVAVNAVPDVRGEAELDPTPVTFVMSGGQVKCMYPIVIFNEPGTCLVLAVKDPPPGAPLFTPTAAGNMDVVVGEGANAVRYTVVSFGATFRFGPWNMLVLAIRDTPDPD